MVWTSPKTFVAAELVLRGDFTTYIKGNQREMAPAKATTKGDMLVALAANSIDRLPVGADNTSPEADSAETLGIKWTDVRIPSGLIMFKSSGSCPSGWTEYTNARGRAIVGLVSGGTIEGTVGTALTDLQDKTHSHTGPSHTHTFTLLGMVTGGASSYRFPNATDAAGTGATSTSARSVTIPFRQLLLCKKD